jgi:hypothetical protein
METERAAIELSRDGIVCKVVIDRELLAPVQFQHGPDSHLDRFRSNVEWKVISGVAVPVKYTATFTMPDVVAESWEFNLEWLTVNEDIPDDEFEYASFTGIPPDLHNVIDFRSDSPRLVGRWVGSGVVRPLDAPPPPATEDMGALPTQSGWRGAWVWINVVFVLLLVGLAVARRTRAGSNTLNQ